MVLFSFKNKKEDRPGFPCEKFRWTFQIGKQSIGFVHQYFIGGKWYDSHTATVELWISRHFKFGIDHTYYDGPHCCLSVGWLKFTYSGLNQNCRKCWGEE